MAAPSPTTRGTPTGIMAPDGYQALITISGATTVSLWEKAVTPPGVDGGEAIPLTTMHTTRYRRFGPRALITLTPVSMSVGYDPAVYDTIISLVNSRTTTITIEWYDGSTLAFYGFLQKFEPQQLQEGAMPEANCTIVPTNWDPTNNVEAGPLMTSVSGT